MQASAILSREVLQWHFGPGETQMRTMWQRRHLAAWTPILLVAAAATSGCKSLNEKYIAMEVWKYERCFGHPPPGFVGAPPRQPPMAAPAMQPCAQGVPYQPMQPGCDVCAGAPLPTGSPMVVPGPTGMGMTSSRPVVISDEVVLP